MTPRRPDDLRRGVLAVDLALVACLVFCAVVATLTRDGTGWLLVLLVGALWALWRTAARGLRPVDENPPRE